MTDLTEKTERLLKALQVQADILDAMRMTCAKMELTLKGELQWAYSNLQK